MITIRQILRGALTRTFPAVCLAFGVFVAASSYARTQITVAQVAESLGAGLFVAAGSAFALMRMRRHLRADAGITGRRAFLVGLAAFGAALTIRPFLPGLGLGGDLLLLAGSGAALATTVYFPWLGASAEDVADAVGAPAMSELPPGEVQLGSRTEPHRASVHRDA